MLWIQGRELLRYNDKVEVVKQWQNDPCGSSVDKTFDVVSLELSRRLESRLGWYVIAKCSK